MRLGIFRAWFLGSMTLSIVACGGDDEAVPIDDIPPDEKLVDLSSAEREGVCDWTQGVAREKLAGTSLQCNGAPITFSGCIDVPAECPATIAQWRVCVPPLLDRLFADPCQVIEFAFSESAFRSFIEETPGCETLGPCGTATSGSP